MSLTIEQQITTALHKSAKPLIVFKRHFSGDALSAAIALRLLLQKLNKPADIACDGFVLPEGYKFLPAKEMIQNKLETLRQMIISIPVDKTDVEQFHYDVTDSELKIFLSPKKGFFGPQDVRATASPWKYDLIITLDTPDLESLGGLYADNREFFYERPIINIDCSPANEQYGQMNLIDLTSSSTCGVLYNLIKAWDEKLFDPDINTCLLAGIIDKTRSFKAGMINPQTLTMSSDLISRAARREEIVKHLYYNKDIKTLKLWGRVLGRLSEHYNGKLVIAQVTPADFAETGTAPANLPEIIDELISSVPSVEVAVLLYQAAAGPAQVMMKSLGAFNPLRALSRLQPTGDKNLVKIQLPDADLATAEHTLLEEIKKSYRPEFS
ncbi:hypothetical protein HY933_00275 [Candidatus Falkowbacteria bacterium]|nr:hypothetical protein [Candidatus Falkowbacteria bacterium]